MEALESGKEPILIIGAGAIGCSIAYHLARKGIRSTIIDKESIGSRASGKAWAVISYPPFILATARNRDSYFGMPGGETVARWQDLYWAVYHRMADLALDMREWGQVDIAFGSVPMTLAAASERAEKTLKQLASNLADSGYEEHEWLGKDDLRAIFPGINAKVIGGLSIPQLQVEPYKYTLGLAQAAEAMGTVIRHGDVVDFETKGERILAARLASGSKVEFDEMVIAMGPWSGPAASRLGVEIPAHITMEECIRLKAPKGYPLRSITCGVEIISCVDGDLILATAEVRSKSHDFESKKGKALTIASQRRSGIRISRRGWIFCPSSWKGPNGSSIGGICWRTVRHPSIKSRQWAVFRDGTTDTLPRGSGEWAST